MSVDYDLEAKRSDECWHPTKTESRNKQFFHTFVCVNSNGTNITMCHIMGNPNVLTKHIKSVELSQCSTYHSEDSSERRKNELYPRFFQLFTLCHSPPPHYFEERIGGDFRQ